MRICGNVFDVLLNGSCPCFSIISIRLDKLCILFAYGMLLAILVAPLLPENRFNLSFAAVTIITWESTLKRFVVFGSERERARLTTKFLCSLSLCSVSLASDILLDLLIIKEFRRFGLYSLKYLIISSIVSVASFSSNIFSPYVRKLIKDFKKNLPLDRDDRECVSGRPWPHSWQPSSWLREGWSPQSETW